MKKIFSAFLLMTMMVFSVGSFVSCSDLENEISKVDTQASTNAAAIESLNSEIAALKTALSAAQADADAAMTAAKAAKEAGDAAKAEAEAAKAAAAQAKADAIAAVAEELEAIQTAIAVNVEAITNLSGSVNANAVEIEALQGEVKDLQTAAAEAVYAITNLNGSVEKHENAIADLETEVAVLKATIAKYEENLKELGLFDENMKTQIEGITYAITNLDKAVETNTNEIDALKEMLEAVVEQVETLNASLVVIYDILGALASQIQSVVFVPEYDTDVVYAQRYTVGSAKTNYIAVATYEVRPAKLAATVTSENVTFSSVDVKATKAAAPEYFAAEVISTDANTGRIVVAAIINDKDSKKADNDYDVLADGKLALSLNIASIDVTELIIAESEPVNVPMVSSEYVNVVANNDENITIGFKNDTKFFTTYDKTIEMPWNTAVSESVRNLFVEPVVVKVADRYLSPADANAVLGTSLAVTTAVKTTYVGAEEKKVYPVAVSGKDMSATASLVASSDYPGDKAVGKKSESTLTVTVKNGKADVTTLTATATYKVVNKKSDFAIASVSEDWKYTYGKQMTVKGRELAVTGYSFPEALVGKTYEFKAVYGEDDELSATTDVTVMSSKAVKFSNVVLPFAAGKASTYTFTGKVNDGTTDYTVAFDVVLAAMPENTNIDLGTYTITGDVKNYQQVAVSPVAKAVEYIKNYDSEITIEKAYTLAAVAGVKGDGVTLNGEEDANAASLVVTTALNEKNDKVRDDKSYVNVAPVVNYANTVVVVKTYEFCGVQFTYTATVKTEQPAIKFVTNDVFVKDGVATVDGTVKLPVTSTKTAVTTGTSTPYALNAIDLRNYVHVEMPADVKENGYELRYTLVTPMVDEDGEALYSTTPSVKQVYNKVDTDRSGEGVQPLSWNVDLNALEYEIALVSSSRGIDRNEDKKVDANDDVVFGTVNVKLEIPTLVTVAAEETVSAKYVNGVKSEANIVNALTVVDKFGNNVYNPYATTLNDLFKGYNATLYNGKVQNVTIASDNFFNVYDMAVEAAELKDVKVYLNNTPVAQSQVNFSYNDATGAIVLSEENANLTGDIKFEVPVTFTYKYDNYGKLAQKVTAVVVFSQNAEAGEGTEVAFPNPNGLQWAFEASFSFNPETEEWDYTTHVLDFGVTTANAFTWGAPSAFEGMEGSYMPMMTAPFCEVVPTDATSGTVVLYDYNYDEETYEILEGKGNQVAAFAYTNFNGETMSIDLGEVYSDPVTENSVVECTLVKTPVEITNGGIAPWNN